MNERVQVAVAQFAPVNLDREATVAKVCDVVLQAASDGAELVVFPECTVPAYPAWRGELSTEPASRGWLDYWELLVEESVEVPSASTRSLGDAARASGAFVVVGVNERDATIGGPRLFNTALLFGPSGDLLGRHRKTVPVLHERLYHDPGDIDQVVVIPTEIGRIGVGICFENLHPLYRYALLAQGEEIHCALWVSVAEDRHLMPVAAQQHAAEGAVFVVAAGQAAAESTTRSDWMPDQRFVGGSCVVAPGGRMLVEQVLEREEILHAVLERRLLARAHAGFHLLGKDARRDLFGFRLAGPRAELGDVEGARPSAGNAEPGSRTGTDAKRDASASSYLKASAPE